MQSAIDHYDSHLGKVYSWMVGDLQAAGQRAAAELDWIGIGPAVDVRSAGGSGGTAGAADLPIATAVDLGAGFGLHALALARRGYNVTAVDTCRTLLDELQARTLGESIVCLEGDIRDFRKRTPAPVNVILCMGDTLTHLPEQDDVERLLADVAGILAPGGTFAATFRDYVSAPLSGDRRFIPVRSDENRILTCFLEYGERTVTVHDVLHERAGGHWRMRVSSYPKLRLDPQWVAETLAEHDLQVRRDITPSGMALIAAAKRVRSSC